MRGTLIASQSACESARAHDDATAADPNEEKKARGALQASVERLLSKKDVVIADGLNYIKGFRYQLHCIAKALGTPQCVVRDPPCASSAV